MTPQMNSLTPPNVNFPRNITIVGLGLMGGSLAAACRKKFPRATIVGLSQSRTAIRFAKQRGWIHEGHQMAHVHRRGIQNPRRGIRLFEKNILDLYKRSASSLIILCTPVQTNLKLLFEIERVAKGKIFVTDVGSVKGGDAWFYERVKWRHVVYVGAHPMVGSHLRGIEAARQDLYQKGYTFLVRPSTVKTKDYLVIKKFWKKIMPKVVEISASEHDRVVGQISHLPHAAAACLMLAAKGPALKFAAQGFRDTTRIAAGDPSIWLPIFQANRRVLAELLAEYEKSLSRLRRSLGKKKAGELQKILAQAARIRQEISL